VLHSTDHLVSVFALIESTNKTMSLVADTPFDLLMLKMSSFYQAKKRT
jgi:hypothetical protein